jgi:hypothetical protein
LLLLENFHDPFAALEHPLRLRVEVGAELGEGRELAELGKVALDAACDLFSSL